MSTSTFQNIKRSLLQLYLDDKRPWLVGFSGGRVRQLWSAAACCRFSRASLLALA
jgi:hypothetical protein